MDTHAINTNKIIKLFLVASEKRRGVQSNKCLNSLSTKKKLQLLLFNKL